jgi:uncharacterized glyoxalase superfamily protein PhnB
MQVQPYLMFDGRCEEALEFYRQALGARVEALLRFKDSPDPMPSSTAARCRCRLARPSSPRASAWSPTGSACRG